MTGTGFDARNYWETRLRTSFDLSGVGYRRLGKRYNEWMYRVRARVFSRLVRSLPMDWSGARVLDVGAGTGFYVEQWHRLGAARVTGVDLTETAVAELSRRFPGDTFLRLDIGEPFESGAGVPVLGSFDAVSAMDVLFHLVNDAQYARAIANVASLLRPGGWFLWSDNFLRHGTERVAHQASRSLVHSEELVRGAGFEILGRTPMFVLMNYPADTRSRVAQVAWTAMVAPAVLAEPLGWCLGALLFPIEAWLTKWAQESPTTEIMVCRKAA